MRLRKRTNQILRPVTGGDWASRSCDVLILTAIVVSVLGIILESVASIRDEAPQLFRWLEIVTVVIFTVEYVLRLWSCVEEAKYKAPLSGRLRFAATPLALIDLAAILPFYLPFIGLDLRFIRVVRLLRLFRVAKLGRYSESLQLLGRVISEKKAELGITLFVLLLLVVLASCLLYHVENPTQPDAFPSIPAAMWWAVATLTTVGYGDVYPVTILGKFFAAIIAILGIGMFALPTGILGAGFVEQIQTRRRGPARCPHCGKALTADTEVATD